MAKTTIQVDAATRDRIRAHGLAGMTYDDILNRVLDATDREAFLAAQRDKILHPEKFEWIDLDDL
jgi:hypothetical protein